MARIKTSKGYLEYENQILYFGDKVMNTDKMLEDLQILSVYLDKIDINWGPAFGTLIGIVRNDDFQPWKPVFDIYILKEDEERFKDILWSLIEVGFRLVRYERRGRYYLERDGEFFKIFVLQKISTEVRHTGSTDFIHEKYIQNTVKWDFKGIELNVPQEVDEYFTFQYGDWTVPKQTVWYKKSTLARWYQNFKFWVMDHVSDNIYYYYTFIRRQRDFKVFKDKCNKAGIPLPENVQLANMHPRKYKKVLTVGVYDLLHKGHVELYRRAKGLGDYLIVAAQDCFIQVYCIICNTIPLSISHFKYMIKSIRYVDEVITYTDVDRIVQEVDFDVFVTGPDQIHSGFQRAIKWCEEHGKEHIVLARTDGVSSSELKAKIAAITGKK